MEKIKTSPILSSFNRQVLSRYLTLELNIKSKSNSFYDAYLDLFESIVKFYLDNDGITYDETRTCGYLLRSNDIRDYFTNQLHLSQLVYDKNLDYIKKINGHKHYQEKFLTLETVLNYMRAFFGFVNGILESKKKDLIVSYTDDYYLSLFGLTEKLNKEYRDSLKKLTDELQKTFDEKEVSTQDKEEFKRIISTKDDELLSLESQNEYLQTQISLLKDLKLSTLEEKLNHTINLLLVLQDSIIENKVLTKTVGATLVGEEKFNAMVIQAKKDGE